MNEIHEFNQIHIPFTDHDFIFYRFSIRNNRITLFQQYQLEESRFILNQ